MKKTVASLGWLLLLIPFFSIAGGHTLISTANHQEAGPSINLPTFSAIASSGSYDVYVTLGSPQAVRIEGDQERIEQLELKVVNKTLRIGSKNRNWIRGSLGKVSIYITVPYLEAISVSGSGSIKVNGTIKAGSLSTAVSGSGNIEATVNVAKINSSISGSGNLRIGGVTNQASLVVSGSGSLNGRALKASVANIQVSGSGNVTVHVENTLNAAVSGSGSVRYTGNPAVHSTKSGSGSVRPL